MFSCVEELCEGFDEALWSDSTRCRASEGHSAIVEGGAAGWIASGKVSECLMKGERKKGSSWGSYTLSSLPSDDHFCGHYLA